MDHLERLSSHCSATVVEEAASVAKPTAEGTVDLTAENPAKRSHASMEESEAERPLSVEARSVAIDLGMLSLHSDSRQKHYLGSSSGLLFTNLIGVDSEGQASSPVSSSSTSTAHPRRLAPLRPPSGESYQSLYARLGKELPSPEDAGLLFGIYFQDIHIDHPFLHPASLVNAYQALYRCTQHGFNGRVDRHGWIHGTRPFPYNGKFDLIAGTETTPISIFTAVFHVFLALSLAATILTRKKNYDHSPSRLYRMAMSAASDCFSSVSVPALQGILLLAVQSTIGPAGLNIWTLIHIAMSHCIDLGLHREPSDPSDLSPTSLAIRRYIFYTVYSLDRSIATIQGRPLGIRDETFDVRMPTLDDIINDPLIVTENELEIRAPLQKHLALSICRFQLDQYISEIKLLFYHLPTRGRPFVWPTDLASIQERIKSDLDQWLADTSRIIPAPEIDEESVLSHCEKLKLELAYHAAIALLFQPSQVFRSPTQHALSLCYHSSSQRLRIYSYLDTGEMLYYSWRNIHGIFSSGATIVYCFWASRELQTSVPFAEALRDLRTCSNLLSIGGQWWPSVRSGKDSFDKIVDLTIKQLSQRQVLSTSSSPPPRRRALGTSHPNDQSVLTRAENEDIVVGEEGIDLSFQAGWPQSSFVGDFNPSIVPYDTFYSDGSEVPAIDSAMQSFLAEYLHGDWGWDPFSGSV
ncbi:hypothetical protein AWENTII_011730 [Aspergillus wentii]